MPIFTQKDGKLVPGGPDALKKQLEKICKAKAKRIAEASVKAVAKAHQAEAAARKFNAGRQHIAKKKPVSRGTVKKAIKKIIKKVKGKSNGRQTKTKKRAKT